MTHPFSFHSTQYDFWEIYEAIRKYYPIGIHRGEKGIYFEYPGIKELERIAILSKATLLTAKKCGAKKNKSAA